MIKREMLKNVKIEDVKPYENNPVNHKANVEHIVNSLKEFGYVKTSIVVNEDNILLAGHGTLQAMKKLKWELIPEVTKVIGLTEEQQRAVRIADNSSGHASEWDLELLDIELKDIAYDMSRFGLEPIINPEIDLPELKDGDKSPFQQVTFILSDEQAEVVKQKIQDIKKTEHYKHIETFGNENTNGNALYALVIENGQG